MKPSRLFFLVVAAILLSHPAHSESPVALTMRVHDILDGFLKFESSSLQIGDATKPDQIVPWGQGDVGDSSIEVMDIYGKVRRQHLYIYQQGENADKTLHDVGAFGGAKLISAAAVAGGIDCESGPQQFQHAYVPVEIGQNLCIKTRSGTAYAVIRVLDIGPNGIRVGILAGAQPKSQFPPL